MAEHATIAQIPPDNPVDTFEETLSAPNVASPPPQSSANSNSNNNSNNTPNTSTTTTTPSANDFGVSRVATVSAAWAYDALTPRCHGCRSEFNLINRRHHCRLCGKIFCQKCSGLKALIPPASIVLVPEGGKKAAPRSALQDSLDPFQDDPDRMLTYISSAAAAPNAPAAAQELLYGKGLEERLQLARTPLRVCGPCYGQLQSVQEELRVNSNAMRFNIIDPTDTRRLFNSPVAFTLGHEVRKAAYTLNNLLPLPKRMGSVLAPAVSEQRYNPNNLFPPQDSIQSDLQACKENCSTVSPNLANLDGVRIPARLVEMARGIAVLTVLKTGFGLAGVEFGTGLVTARLGANNQWSAPSAIGTAGVSWGALVGAQVTDHVFLLMTDQAVQCFFQNQSVQLGADLGVAVGPVGRAVEADLSMGNVVAPVYTYSQSKGLYAGASLDGKVVVTRHQVNEKFYGCRITGEQLLQGSIPSPPAAEPLYAALQRCHVYATRENGNANLRRTGGEEPTRLLDEYGEPSATTTTSMAPSAPPSDMHSVALSELTTEY